ncbi:MAG TPA: trypsin-like peptidase domain-containing protein [Hyphomicrobiaceae bacterium]|nr:trypsin-like peptidase domain-containing protein [Hyphomicrobiaceae bacterium]
MRNALVSIALFMALPVSAHGQQACPTESEFTGDKSPEVLKVLASLRGTVESPGIGRCSGVLATFAGRSSSSRALFLSAGHCVNRGTVQIASSNSSLAVLADGEVLHRTSYQRPLTLDTGSSEAPRTCLEADEIVYATMTGGDILLLRLTETYDQIERRTGVKPFVISQDTTFAPGLPVRMPSSRWQNDRACHVDKTIDRLKEHSWMWGPVFRLRVEDTCGLPHGASGSPIIRTDTEEVIGVAGTASDGDKAACELNNPCEVNPDGSTSAAAREQPYGHFVHAFYTCLDSARDLDLTTPGCRLPKPKM